MTVARDPLPPLRRLHRIELSAARLGLAEALHAEAETGAALERIEQQIRSEAAALQAGTHRQARVDAHAAWLAATAAARQVAGDQADAARTQVEGARRGLADAHAASRLLDAIAVRSMEQQRVTQARREQSEMETAISGRRVERVTGIEPA